MGELGQHKSAAEHTSAFNRYDDCTASPPSTLIKLGPKEQNNSVTGRFEKRPGGNKLLRTALTHDALGAAGGEEGAWQKEAGQIRHEAGLLYRAGLCLAALPGSEFGRQSSKYFPAKRSENPS